MQVTDEIGLTTSKDILQAVAEGTGPNQFFLTLVTPVGRRGSWSMRSRSMPGSAWRPTPA